MSRRRDLVRLVMLERERHEAKHGTVEEEGKTSWQHLSLLVEEVGECSRALNEDQSLVHLEEELVQVMASAMAWAELLPHQVCDENAWPPDFPSERSEAPNDPDVDSPGERVKLCLQTARVSPEFGGVFEGTCFLPDHHAGQHIFVEPRQEKSDAVR